MGLRRLIDLLRRQLLIEKSSKKEFKKEYWRDINKRKYYIRSIMESSEYIGKTKQEIESCFGNNECSLLYQNRWSYFIEITLRKKYELVFYFEDDLLIDIRYEYKYLV